MNAHTLRLSLLTVFASGSALAQDYHSASPVYPAVIQPAVAVQLNSPCGPRPASAPGGTWELRTTQQYVPGALTQVYVGGQCWGRGYRRHCEPGRYVTQQLPGHYESRQEWVWVPYGASVNVGFGVGGVGVGVGVGGVNVGFRSDDDDDNNWRARRHHHRRHGRFGN